MALRRGNARADEESKAAAERGAYPTALLTAEREKEPVVV